MTSFTQSSSFSPSLPTLHLIPLLSTTAALMFSFDQHFFLSKFLTSGKLSSTHAAAVLPTYFSIANRKALPQQLILNTIGLGSSLWTLRGYYRARRIVGFEQLHGSMYCMIGGVVFLLIHSAFSLAIEPIAERIIARGDGGVENKSDFKDKGFEGKVVVQDAISWLGVHTRRLIVADVPTWLCFFYGLLHLSRF